MGNCIGINRINPEDVAVNERICGEFITNYCIVGDYTWFPEFSLHLMNYFVETRCTPWVQIVNRVDQFHPNFLVAKQHGMPDREWWHDRMGIIIPNDHQTGFVNVSIMKHKLYSV